MLNILIFTVMLVGTSVLAEATRDVSSRKPSDNTRVKHRVR